MAARTYKTRALVLRKRKLREKDLIVILLCEDGTLLSAVAKGARKPGGSHAARLELFRCADLMLAHGSLDVICESRLVEDAYTPAEMDKPAETGESASSFTTTSAPSGVSVATLSLEQTTCASPVAELLSYVAQEDLMHPRLFELARASFDYLAHASGDELLSLCAAALWKVLAQAGYRPSFAQCVRCGRDCLTHEDASHSLAFSALEGGCICASCPAPADAVRIDVDLAQWCEFLIGSQFSTIYAQPLDTPTALSVLSLTREWTQVYIGKRLASLDFLFTCGLFDGCKRKGAYK